MLLVCKVTVLTTSSKYHITISTNTVFNDDLKKGRAFLSR